QMLQLEQTSISLYTWQRLPGGHQNYRLRMGSYIRQIATIAKVSHHTVEKYRTPVQAGHVVTKSTAPTIDRDTGPNGLPIGGKGTETTAVKPSAGPNGLSGAQAREVPLYTWAPCPSGHQDDRRRW